MRMPKKAAAYFVTRAPLAAVVVSTPFVSSYLQERRVRAEEEKAEPWWRWLSDPDRDSIPEPPRPDLWA